MIDARLHDAARRGDTATVLALLQDGNGVGSEEGNVALYWAAASGHSDTVEALLDRGVDINAAEPRGHTAARAAAENGHANLLRYFLERGAKPPCAALTRAAGTNVETVRLLIAAGAEVNMKDELGRTPLMQAVIDGKYDIAEFLLENGADADIQNRDGYSALRFATARNRSDLMQLLGRYTRS